MTGPLAAGLGDTVAAAVADGSMLAAAPLAVLAGLVSFASPCVLPLVPGYLGYLGGMVGSEASGGRGGRARGGRACGARAGGARAGGARVGAGVGVRAAARPSRGATLLGVALFVAGFTVVFVTLGVVAGSVGATLVRWSDVITRVLGVVVVLMGLVFVGRLPFAQRTAKLRLAPRAGLWGAPVLGVVFGLGWTPCIGPTLVAVYSLALGEGSAVRGAVLAVAYCVGLGLPFLLLALGFERSTAAFGFLRRHRLAIMRAGGVVLVLVGLALVTGLWGEADGCHAGLDRRLRDGGVMPADRIDALPRLGVVGWLRWCWRQLTSMRVALMLLMLLAVVAIPGSILPQRPVDPSAVAQYVADNPRVGAWLDRLGLFDVYASVWFSAVYLLLFVSLIGCILPRLALHARALRARPPRAPRRFERFGEHDAFGTTASADAVLAAATRALRGPVRALPRFRVAAAVEPSGARTLSAERGYLRETGNLLFHLALVGLLVSIALGQLFHYRGQAIVVEGRGFANSVTDYDTFVGGTGFDPSSLVPFTLHLDRFEATFRADAKPESFQADVTVTLPGGAPRDAVIRVNDPLTIGGARVYLQGNGYAPDVEVRDAAGQVAFAGAVPFLPQDAVYTSRGVVKVPDVSTGEQIGLVGYLLPSAVITPAGAASVHPEPRDPVLVLAVWRGDLGLDTGVPQNVYQLDTDRMTQVTGDDGAPVTIVVRPGQTVELPDGLGTFTWHGLPRFVALDLRHDPALGAILGFAIAALVGLVVSLFTPRRRVWVRVTEHEGVTSVALAALARGDDAGLAGELERVAGAVRALGGADVGSGDPASGDGEGGDEPR